MPAASNLTIFDGQATPVSHVLVPIGPDQKDTRIFILEEPNATSSLGNMRCTLSVKRPAPAVPGQSAAERVSRVQITLATPVLETVNASTYNGITPAPTLAYVPRCSLEFIIPERSTTQQRTDLRTLIKNALVSSQVVAAVDSLQGLY